MNGNDAPGQQWGPPQAPAPRTSRSARSALTHTLAVVLGLIIGGVIGASTAGDSGTESTPPPPTATATATVTETATATTTAPAPAPEEDTPTAGRTTTPAGPADEIPGDGTYVVGQDIEPGTYRTAGPEETALPNCYWARLSGTSGEFDEIIANGNTAGPTTVTISAGDEAFQTTGCQTWEKTG
ncbi:hypothetical protein ABZ078_30890 [Streptomyces sp. NPDC006385]|uniref:hypothetical protein n=1 Tax=Streptomyces sp. NPDC006385 TaxID=3156761 RepID=UPI0033A75B0C